MPNGPEGQVLRGARNQRVGFRGAQAGLGNELADKRQRVEAAKQVWIRKNYPQLSGIAGRARMTPQLMQKLDQEFAQFIQAQLAKTQQQAQAQAAPPAPPPPQPGVPAPPPGQGPGVSAGPPGAPPPPPAPAQGGVPAPPPGQQLPQPGLAPRGAPTR